MSDEKADIIINELKRIAEALEALALKEDPQFQPKSITLNMRPKKR